VAQIHRTWWRVTARLRRLLISHGPPHYGMGYALYQLLGGCAPWPGEKRWVLIRFASVCVGYGLRRHLCCPQLGCGSGPSSDVGGWSPAAGATAEEVILPLRGGVYGGSTPSGDCPALCGGFRSGDLPSAIRWLATVCADPCWGVSTFSPLERAPLHWNIRGLRPASARQKEVPRLWLCNNGQCVA
jgi:hypothetical protein